MTAPRESTPQDGFEVLGALVLQVAEGARSLLESEGLLPLANGSIMRELQVEPQFAAPDPWGSDPIMAARDFASTAFFAATDHMKAFAACVFTRSPFAPFVSARAGLEACAVSDYLAEQGIAPSERVRRIVNERLLDIHDNQHVARNLANPGPPELAGALADMVDRVTALTTIATTLGFTVIAGNERTAYSLDKRRPTATALIRRLFPQELGLMLYHVLSAPSHSRPGGLLRSAAVGSVSPVSPLVANITLTGRDVTFLTSACLLALGQTARSLIAMNGWNSSEWDRLHINALQIAQVARKQEWSDYPSPRV